MKSNAVQIVITSLQRAKELKGALLELGVEKQDIHSPSYSYEEILRREKIGMEGNK